MLRQRASGDVACSAAAEDPAAVRKIHDGSRDTIRRITRARVWHVVCSSANEGAHMIKITNVLVATDFSETSESALNYGREFARTFGATLHVLHVVENAVMWAGPEAAGIDFVQLQAELEAGARNTLDRIVTAEDREQLKAVTAVRTGSSPAFEIAALCQGGGHRHHPDGNPRARDDGPSADGQRRREGGAHRAMPRADGAPSRARVHPAGRARGDRHGEALTLAPRCRPYLLPPRVSCCATARPPACGRQPCPIATPCGASSTSSRPPRGGFAFSRRPRHRTSCWIDSVTTASRSKALTLIVCREDQQGTHIIGVGSYFAESETSAEVAFAVDDRFHGRGIATALLERLAVYGRDQNFEYFSASVLPENSEMLDVFRDSGFDVRSTTDAGVVEVRLSLAILDGQHRRRRRARATGDDRIASRDSEAARGRRGRRLAPRIESRPPRPRVAAGLGIPGAHLSRESRPHPSCTASAASSPRAICRPASTSPSSPCRASRCLRPSTTAPSPA